MNKIYETAYNLRATDFDRWSRLRPASILELFQDIAGRHADDLGIGLEPMLEKNLVWVIVKARFRILKSARMHQTVRIRTWPLHPERVGYTREFIIFDENGDSIVEGSSEWVLMDFVNRKIIPAGEIYPLDEFCEIRNYPGRFPRLRSFEADGEAYSFAPPYSDFDMNGHVNNTRYANFVMDAMVPNESEALKEFRIEYHREVLPGETLNIFSRREENAFLARGENSAGEKMFTCHLEF